MTNEDLIRDFSRGESGTANNLASVPVTRYGRMFLVGYGHAVYAVRHEDGTITLFNGWRGRSTTTSQHLSLIDDATVVNEEREEQLTVPRALQLYGPNAD
jgi:hypothetical protein